MQAHSIGCNRDGKFEAFRMSNNRRLQTIFDFTKSLHHLIIIDKFQTFLESFIVTIMKRHLQQKRTWAWNSQGEAMKKNIESYEQLL